MDQHRHAVPMAPSPTLAGVKGKKDNGTDGSLKLFTRLQHRAALLSCIKTILYIYMLSYCPIPTADPYKRWIFCGTLDRTKRGQKDNKNVNY